MGSELMTQDPQPSANVPAGAWSVSTLGRGKHLDEVCRQVDHAMPAAYGFAAVHSDIPLVPGRVVVTGRARMVLASVLAEAAHSGARGRLRRASFALRLAWSSAGQYRRADAITGYGHDGQVTVLIDARAMLLHSPAYLVEVLASGCVRAAQMQDEGRFELYALCLATIYRRRYDALALAASRHLACAEEDQVERVVAAVREQQLLSAEPRRQLLLREALAVARRGERAGS
jgi:hypothetical protein